MYSFDNYIKNSTKLRGFGWKLKSPQKHWLGQTLENRHKWNLVHKELNLRITLENFAQVERFTEYLGN
jgi:hypothetical protein